MSNPNPWAPIRYSVKDSTDIRMAALARDSNSALHEELKSTYATKAAVAASDSALHEELTSTYAPLAHKTSHATGGEDALTPADIGAAPALGADDNYVTDAEKTVIGNTSGTNTGDQDLSGYAPISGQFATHTLTAAASVTLSADYPAQALTMTTDTTLAAPTVTDSIAIVFLLSGEFTPTWWAGIKWAGGTPTTYASAGTLYHLLKLGGTWYGSGQAYS